MCIHIYIFKYVIKVVYVCYRLVGWFVDSLAGCVGWLVITGSILYRKRTPPFIVVANNKLYNISLNSRIVMVHVSGHYVYMCQSV